MVERSDLGYPWFEDLGAAYAGFAETRYGVHAALPDPQASLDDGKAAAG